MEVWNGSDKHVKKNPSWIKKGLFLILTLFLTGRILESLLQYCILAQGFTKVKLTLEQDECILTTYKVKIKSFILVISLTYITCIFSKT